MGPLAGRREVRMGLEKIGILTGGGDCSGLNAVIRAVTRTAVIEHKARVIGIEGGFEGLIANQTQELTTRSTRDILTLGGTILGTTNKGNASRGWPNWEAWDSNSPSRSNGR